MVRIVEFRTPGTVYFGLVYLVPALHALPVRARKVPNSPIFDMLVRTHAVSWGRLSVVTTTSMFIVVIEEEKVGRSVVVVGTEVGLEVGWPVLVGLEVGWLVLVDMKVGRIVERKGREVGVPVLLGWDVGWLVLVGLTVG